MPRMGVTALLVPVLLAGTVHPASRLSVLVVSEAGVDAYNEALSGVTMVLPAGSFRLVDAGGKAFDHEIAGALEGNESRVIIAVGSRALAEVRARHAGLPIVSTMVVHAGEADAAVRRVAVEIPLSVQLAAMKSLWPGRVRAGIIRGHGQARVPIEVLEAIARKEGFSLAVVDCDGPPHLLKALAAFKGKVDFVLCPPDSDLYNAVTIKPLVLASLEQRLPLVGFSPAFVRAGAAAGIFPDYGDMGRQSAEMALRLMRGEDHVGDEAPRKVSVAVNQRVTRLLGVEFRPDSAVEVYK
jgi:putative ABC transport system substrate-binding protein